MVRPAKARTSTLSERVAVLETEVSHIKQTTSEMKTAITSVSTKQDVIITQLSTYKGGGWAITAFLGLAASAVAVLAWFGIGKG